jgi:hypothetical protein
MTRWRGGGVDELEEKIELNEMMWCRERRKRKKRKEKRRKKKKKKKR